MLRTQCTIMWETVLTLISSNDNHMTFSVLTPYELFEQRKTMSGYVSEVKRQANECHTEHKQLEIDFCSY